MSPTRIAGPRVEVTEKAFDADLFNSQRGLATRLGWISYHVLRSRGSKAGFPDRVIWRDRVIFAELKSSKGATSEYQQDVLTRLARAGAEVYLWHPGDEQEIGEILGRRWVFAPAASSTAAPFDADLEEPILSFVDGSHLAPASAWLKSGARRDGELA